MLVYAYLNNKFYGVMDNLETKDSTKAIDFIVQHSSNSFRAMVNNYSDCINYDSIKPFIKDGSLNGIIINSDNNKIVQCCGYSFENGLYNIVL